MFGEKTDLIVGIQISFCFITCPSLHINDDTMVLKRCHEPTDIKGRVVYVKSTIPVFVDNLV